MRDHIMSSAKILELLRTLFPDAILPASDVEYKKFLRGTIYMYQT